MSRSSGHYAGGCCCKRHRPKGQNYGDGYRYRPRMRRRRTQTGDGGAAASVGDIILPEGENPRDGGESGQET